MKKVNKLGGRTQRCKAKNLIYSKTQLRMTTSQRYINWNNHKYHIKAKKVIRKTYPT